MLIKGYYLLYVLYLEVFEELKIGNIKRKAKNIAKWAKITKKISGFINLSTKLSSSYQKNSIKEITYLKSFINIYISSQIR